MKPNRILFPLLILLGLVGCKEKIQLHNGQKFLYQYAGSVETWTVKGNNGKGYYCQPSWCNDCKYFFTSDDLNDQTFQIIK